MKKVLIASLLLCLLVPSSAHAHVLLQDSGRKMGAVLHITPDDDPAAGEPSSLVFEIQDHAVTNKNYSFTLYISSPSGDLHVIPISTNNTVISASHTFPTQGLYGIELRADPIDTTKPPFTFTHSQLISRTPISTHSPSSTSEIAEIGLIISSCGFIILGILSWNNRICIKEFVNKR